MTEPRPAGTGNPEVRKFRTRKAENGESPARTSDGSDAHADGEAAGAFPAALRANGLPLANGFMSALAINRPAIDAMVMLSRRLHDGAASSTNAWVGFLHRRINENISMADRLASCRSPEDIYRVNLDYLQKAADEYLAQVERTVMNGRESTMAVLTSLSANSPVAPDEDRQGR